MEIAEDEFNCEDCGGVLIFVKIVDGYALYQCVHCNHCERLKMEEPSRKDTHEVREVQG